MKVLSAHRMVLSTRTICSARKECDQWAQDGAQHAQNGVQRARNGVLRAENGAQRALNGFQGAQTGVCGWLGVCWRVRVGPCWGRRGLAAVVRRCRACVCRVVVSFHLLVVVASCDSVHLVRLGKAVASDRFWVVRI